MRLCNIKHPEETVSFCEATLRSIGKDSGLFFPKEIPTLENIPALLSLPLVERSIEVLNALIGDEIPREALRKIVQSAFNFSAPLVRLNARIATLELFHGPTLAFKDFGGRFMAQMMAHLIETGRHTGPLTIMSATSGDTGAAVAHAFYEVPNIQVVVLYPRGKISSLQEKLFCTLGKNIHTVAIEADFDTCQAMVKQCFTDATLVTRYGLNSANSINISRLLAQVCYYFELCAQHPERPIVVSVPSGNFGNLTAGLIAQRMGAPIKRFVAATNANDTVPRYLSSGNWQARKTIATQSNAMDVSEPNNWPRIETLLSDPSIRPSSVLSSLSVSDAQTTQALKELHAMGYVSEPHGAVAYAGLKNALGQDEYGVFLGTAHPAKFAEAVETTLNMTITLPAPLSAVIDKPLLSDTIIPDIQVLKSLLDKKLQ